MPDYRFLREAPADLNLYAGKDVIDPAAGRDFDYFREIVSDDFVALGDERTAEAQGNTYNELQENYAAHVCTWNAQKGHAITSSKHLAVAAALGVKAVYDFGCGCGSDLLVMANEGLNVGGHDISRYQADFVQWRFALHNMEGQLKYMSDTPDPDTIWPMCYSIYVLEHLPDPEVVMGWMANHAQVLSLTTQFGKTDDHPEHNDYDVSRMDDFFFSRGFERFYHLTRPLMPRMYVFRKSPLRDMIDLNADWRRETAR